MSLRRSARLGTTSAIKLPAQTAPTVSRVQKNTVAKPQKTAKKAAQANPSAASKSSYWSPEPPTVTNATGEDQPVATNPANRHLTPPPLDRPVDPHRTNATLLTPHGSSVLAYPAHTEDASPSKTGLPRPAATTGTLLDQAISHLISTDPRLKDVIEKHSCPLFSPVGLAEQVDPFNSLTSSIIGQQVSGAAAKSIRNKFLALFDLVSTADGAAVPRSRFPLPEEVARCDIATLRTAGLSQRKAEYIQGLAEKFASGELSAQMLARASDEELVEKLTAVRGLGKWSVEMFACFALKRVDVFSTGDLGVQRGCAVFAGRDVSKLKGKGGGKFKYMSEKDMLEMAAKFAPYRSVFMWYMWRIENVDVAVLGG
ncbi:DNA glycosylase [Penicillium capsulatum]|uniref:DNA glycosylase n=1 Tax=Penicillium capsulatum TaxID=69766 RepID=A0A9W9LVN5_9EURO|nr:DNA glycosylase [Penicillium capsulatum]KAJ6122443.1 DNA glycosylase [Penicillium capsulatum]